ncbi:MAG: PD40 domain-containing protein [Candidatus Sericytochromatia bacterium]|nr:PD40 domain-containing protein [Candidatus Sericytochromatia bacterium]
MTSSWPRTRRLWRAGLIPLIIAGCFARVPAKEQDAAQWFPYIAANGQFTDLWAVAVPGGQRRRLTDDQLIEAAPAMLPDRRIVYASREVGRWRLKVVDPRPAAATRPNEEPPVRQSEFHYTSAEADDFGPVVSPSGQVLFVSNRSGRKQIFALVPGQNEASLLTPETGECDNPAPGPDGRIAYTRLLNGSRQVWLVDGDGGQKLQVTNLGYNVTDLTLLPAGKVPPPYRLNQALLMPSAMPGQAYQQLLQSQIIFVAHRRPDARSVVTATGEDLDIFRYDPATKRVMNLTNVAGNDANPVVLPSGLIAFTTDRRGTQEIWTVDAWGGHQQPWIDGESWVSTR